MKTNKLKTNILIATLIIAGSNILNADAQVTVGSNFPPDKGALLQLKTREANNPTSVTDANNITVDANGGGLGLPRVRLENRTTLQPFIPDDNNWKQNIGQQKQKHAGLMVYNINVSDPSVTDKDLIFTQGIYVWDGAAWTLVRDGSNMRKYFYMPSFNIELVPPADKTLRQFDLYKAYKEQFTRQNNPYFKCSNNAVQMIPSPDDNRIYQASELDYVISYYDTSIITINKIDADGVMHYTLDSLALSSKSFINVIFIVK
jgi:hypothetical protein